MKWRRDLNWQVIDLAGASVDDLMQVPVLYLCGNQSPLPEDPRQQRELAQKLRDYLDRGGFLFAEGYCGGDGFDRGFRELMARVFANEPEYRLKLLDASHPIWHAEEKVPPEQHAAAAGDRVRLPHERGVCAARSAGRPAAVAVVPVGAVTERPATAVHPRGAGAD